jgi:8-oxo-dGTP diphosphatase
LKAFDDHGVTRQRCVWCGVVHYENPKAAVGAIVHRNGEILLSERARAPLAGHWDLPGGFLEVGEHPVAAVKRELFEETGLRVNVDALVDVAVGEYGDANPGAPSGNPPAYTLNLVYACRADGTPVARDDSRSLQWFPVDALPGMAFPHEADAIRKWARERFGDVEAMQWKR